MSRLIILMGVLALLNNLLTAQTNDSTKTKFEIVDTMPVLRQNVSI